MGNPIKDQYVAIVPKHEISPISINGEKPSEIRKMMPLLD